MAGIFKSRWRRQLTLFIKKYKAPKSNREGRVILLCMMCVPYIGVRIPV